MQDTFRYLSRYWNSKESFNPSSALKGLDRNEALSPAYWTTPLTKLCLGMMQRIERGMELHWILVPGRHEQSLHSMIANKWYIGRHTSLDRETWISLMKNSSLEIGCLKQGFNPSMGEQRVRIGMVAGRNCNTPRPSMIGFGSTGNYTCGNFKGDNVSGMKHMSSFGYILVQ